MCRFYSGSKSLRIHPLQLLKANKQPSKALKIHQVISTVALSISSHHHLNQKRRMTLWSSQKLSLLSVPLSASFLSFLIYFRLSHNSRLLLTIISFPKRKKIVVCLLFTLISNKSCITSSSAVSSLFFRLPFFFLNRYWCNRDIKVCEQVRLLIIFRSVNVFKIYRNWIRFLDLISSFKASKYSFFICRKLWPVFTSFIFVSLNER